MRQHCPICARTVTANARYPRYVCARCAERATNANGHRLSFSNEGLSGGFIATVTASGEHHAGHDCYIDGRLCHADEARFGDIVIEIK